MIKTIKLGEVQTKVIDTVKSTDELKVLLRYGSGVEITGKLAFNPNEDLKIGDEVKVIIEKVYKEKEPPAKELSEQLKSEVGEGTVAVKETSAPIKMECEDDVAIGKLPEPLEVEGKERAVTEEASDPIQIEGGQEGAVDKI